MRRGALHGAGRARIVIVGCGFGGLFAARALERTAADVLVIDRNNYHLFQPLLYQVACAALAPADIAQPIRTILRHQKNARVMLAEVQRIDLQARYLYAAGSRVPYDYLLLAPGAVDNYFGHEEWRQFAPGMKGVEEATFIRSRLLLSFESAELEADPAERTAHLTFIIVGAGPTGVELAGAIKELAVDVIPRDFRVADTRRARVILIEAGVRAAPLTATLAVPLAPDGRVRVSPDCSVPGHPETFVIGDAAYLVDAASGRPVPGVSQGAMQMGRYVARVIDAELRGARSERAAGFHYRDKGSMATVGKSRAVVEIGRLHFGGWLAWLAWMALHVTVLIGFRNRLAVLSSWIYSYVFFRRGSRLITRVVPGDLRQPLAPSTPATPQRRS